MVTSDFGKSFIKKFEALKLTAYKNFENEPWTIGYGHTGPDVHEGMTITEDRADELFDVDIVERERQLNEILLVTVSQDVFDMVMSLLYNVGIANLSNSGTIKAINAGDETKAFGEWLEFDHESGKISDGLTKRRLNEVKNAMGRSKKYLEWTM